MKDFLEFLQIPIVQMVGWTLGVIGWIVGVGAGYLQWKSYRQQQQDRAPFHYLFDQVQNDWKGQFTKEQVTELTSQFERLEKQIREQIPKEARRVFLEDQRVAFATSIGDLYQQYIVTHKELESINNADPLAPAIQSEIEKEIIPSYIKQRRQQYLINRLIVAILFLVLLPTSPVALLVQFVVFPIILVFLSQEEFIRVFLGSLLVLTILALVVPLGGLRNVIDRHLRLVAAVGLVSLVISIFLFLATFSGAFAGPFPLLLILMIISILFPIAVRLVCIAIIAFLKNFTFPKKTTKNPRSKS